MDQKGVTLIELILSIVIMGIVAVVLTDAFVSSSRSVLTGNLVRDATQEGRLAIDRMIREIRSIRDRRCVITAGQQTLKFISGKNNDGTDKTIEYSWAGGTASLIRKENNDPVGNNLAGSVSNPAGIKLFTYYDNFYDNASTRTEIPAPATCGLATPCSPGCGATDFWSVSIDMTTQSGTETMRFRSEVHPMNF